MMEVEGKVTEAQGVSRGKELLEPKLSLKQAGDEEIGPKSNNYQPYPDAIASCQEVLDDKTLFMKSLEDLHLAMRTKFMVPIIGGKELDLHQLFQEVTSRGGIEKVIADRKWREVTNTFNFPSTATNASFVLRKYYASLLRHYEQIYFFGAKGWSVPSAVPFCTDSIFQPEKSIDSAYTFHEAQSAPRKRRRRGNEDAALTAAALSPSSACERGAAVAGIIDGKFEDGYFITVTIGAKKLKGILFHSSQQNAAFPESLAGGASRRRRRRKKLSSIDPTHPKPNRSGYNFFFAEQHARLKLLHPGKDREISRMIGDLWNNLSEPRRAVYQEIGLKDKERYQAEMAVYRERQRNGNGSVLANVMPIQQRDVRKEAGVDSVNMLSAEETDAEEEEWAAEEDSAEANGESSAAAAAFELRRRDSNVAENGAGRTAPCDLPQRTEEELHGK